MKKAKLPNTDSIQELARFWDSHDLTDFEDQLEEVIEPVFRRDASINVHLAPPEVKAVSKMAERKGISREELIRTWVLQKLVQPRRRPAKHGSGRHTGHRPKAED